MVKKHIKRGRRNKSGHQLTLNKNSLEADWEFGYETISDTLSTFVYPNLALRYGLTEDIELNIELNPITTYQKNTGLQTKTSGFEPVFFGARYALADETKFLPEMAVSLQISPPKWATKNYQANYWAAILQYTIEKNFNSHVAITAGAGLFYDGFVQHPNWLYNLTTNYNFSSKISVGADYFGFAARNQFPLNNIDINIGCKCNQRLTLGAIAGKGISATAHKSYFAVNGTYTFFQPKAKTPANQ
jgi:hypothetical protein